MKLIGYEYINYTNKEGREVKGFRLSCAEEAKEGRSNYGLINANTYYVKMVDMPDNISLNDLEECINYEKEIQISFMPDRFDRSKLGSAVFRIVG